jgi:endonuclease III related protein
LSRARKEKSSELLQYYRALYGAWGAQHWWPAQTRFEVIVGAYLTQNTAWKNVELALAKLRTAHVLSVEGIRELSLIRLQHLIRPSGYFRQKAKRLKTFVAYLDEKYGGSLDELFAQPTDKLRAELLSLNGVGPETADSILLYAGELPSFVVDAYTHRVFARHGWIDFDADYHQIQDYIQGELPQEVPLFNEFHALLVRLGKDYCKKTNPKCPECPLREMLPRGGPFEPA